MLLYIVAKNIQWRVVLKYYIVSLGLPTIDLYGNIKPNLIESPTISSTDSAHYLNCLYTSIFHMLSLKNGY